MKQDRWDTQFGTQTSQASRRAPSGYEVDEAFGKDLVDRFVRFSFIVVGLLTLYKLAPYILAAIVDALST